jgi:hypothetical protein
MRCVNYLLAHYIPATGDVEKALAGQHIVMGFCQAHKKQLCTATTNPCPDFEQVAGKKLSRPEKEGNEWVVR